MDGNRFDDLARGMAAPTTRRRAVGVLAGGGILAALGLRAAPDPAPVAAAPGQTCTLDFVANVRLGPSAGQVQTQGAAQPGELRGQLAVALSAAGGIENGTLRLPDGTSRSVVGHATGRSLHLRIAMAEGQPLVAIGVGEREIAACQGAVDGMATGPQVGDLGHWRAVARGLSGETAGGSAAGGGSSAGGAVVTTQPNSAPPAAPPPQPTQATTAPPVPATQAPAQPTQASAEPRGCPEGEVLCGKYCADLSTDSFHCGACNHGCNLADEECDGGVCVPVGCGPGLTNCSGYCADLSSTSFHCGACGNTCADGQACVQGACVPKVPSPVEQLPQVPQFNCEVVPCPEGYSCFQGNCVALSTTPVERPPFQQPPVLLDPCVGVTCPDGYVCADGGCVRLNPDPLEPPPGL